MSRTYSDYSTQYLSRSIARLKSIFTVRQYYLESLKANFSHRVLDLGCGSNLTLIENLYHFADHITCVDQFSTDSVELPVGSRVEYISCDIVEFLRKNSYKYDLICLFDVLEHFSIEDIVRILTLCYNTLDSGGKIIIQVPNADSPFFTSVFYSDHTHITGLTSKSLSALLHLSGSWSSFKSMECLPPPLKATWLIRRFILTILFSIFRFLHIVETGSSPRFISRVFITKAVKS